MAINLINPTEFTTGILIADTFTPIGGSPYSLPPMTVGVDGLNPASSAVEIQSTLGALTLPRLTTVQRDALNRTPGMIIYNTTTGGLNISDAGGWVIPAGSGTVTSVDLATSGTGIIFTGGPITGSGTITATLDTDLQSISDLITQGIMVRTGAGIVTRSISTADSTAITVADADGVTGNPLLNLATTGATPGSYTQADITVDSYGRITSVASGGGSAGAPANATYITQTPNVFLTNEQALSLLSTGIMKSTTATGVVSIAIPGTDYYSPGFPTRIIDDGFANGNFFIGSGAGNLTYVTAQFNTGLGINSLNAITTGIQNLAAGQDSGLSLTTGNFNVLLGQDAGESLVTLDDVVAVGFNAANALVTGGSVIAIGSSAMSATTSATNVFSIGKSTTVTDGISNSGALGYNTAITVSNAINIGNACLVGLNNSAPAYNLDISNISNTSAIRQGTGTVIPTTASAGLLTYTYTAQTSNTTDLALDLLVLPVNQGVTVFVTITGVDTTHVDTTGGNIVASFMRAAGNISLVGAEYNKNVTSTGDFSVTANTGTQAVRLHATGVSGLTYNWTITVQYQIG